MTLTAAERDALVAVSHALEDAAAKCDEDSPVGAMLYVRAQKFRELLHD